MSPELVGLTAIVAVGFTVQSTVGFGAMLTCLTLGAQWLPIDDLLPQLIPLSMLQAVALMARYGQVAWATLLQVVLPLAAVGLVGGIALRTGLSVDLRPLLGLAVLALAMRELWRGPHAAPPPPAARHAAFLGAGLLQGLFATGGPPLVWGLASAGLPKTAFRSTLVASLAGMNVGLMASFGWQGQLDASTAWGTAWLVVPMVAGTWIGDRLHHHVDESRFRQAVWVLLAAGAVPLLLRGTGLLR